MHINTEKNTKKTKLSYISFIFFKSVYNDGFYFLL